MEQVADTSTDSAAGSTQSAGQQIDQNKGRIFPCEQCGADLRFEVGQQSLQCPFCGHVKAMAIEGSAAIVEQNFDAMLARLVELKEKGQTEEVSDCEIRCESCGGTVLFTGTLTSTQCPYCASPLQRENVHDAEHRVPADGVLPFQVDHARAAQNLREWVSSRWFAPNDFIKQGVSGKFNGIYLSFWTFDSMTSNHYVGQRGEHYYVTVGTGKDKRTERRTRWYPASGFFQRFFDDVLVCASKGLPCNLLLALEPWPLDKCIPFTQQALAGFLAQTYDLPLREGFDQAKVRMDDAIRLETRQRIGGDEQRIISINSRYEAITFKHLLLPTWLLAYRYHEKSYQVIVNAATGEVQGERPYSWVKILFAVVGGIVVAGGVVALIQAFQ